MKRIVFIALLTTLSMSVFAQGHKPHNQEKKKDCGKDVMEIVSDLSSSQRQKIDAVTKHSKSVVDVLKQQEKQVKDSIHLYMRQFGDQSATLFPLFEREASIKCDISKEMYSTKVKIDKILTAKQKEELRAALDKQKKEKPRK